MIGIVLASHGGMCTGMKNTAKMLLGEEKPQFEAVELYLDDAPEVFQNKIRDAVEKADSGDGVIIFADLFGGTPNNQAVSLLSDKVKLVAGMNFPMILDLLCAREFKGDITCYDLDEIVEIGRNGIYNVSGLLNK